MTGTIGYYVHHHGDGHRQRAIAIALQAPDRFVLLGTGLAGRTEGLACIELPDDRPVGTAVFDGADGAGPRPQAILYAPTHHQGVRERVARITSWIVAARPALMVVDVSIEVAMLSRLAATPTVYVRQMGLRTDPAHLDAFRGAQAVLCPFAERLDDPEVEDWIRAKTLYAPGLTATTPARPIRKDVVLIVMGKGGAVVEGDRIADCARAHPYLQWRLAGAISAIKNPPPNLFQMGWRASLADEIATAGVVVGGAGNGLVSAVLAADRPFVCLPEARPFDEQMAMGRALEAAGAAVVHPGWPDDDQWPVLLQEAAAQQPTGRRGLHDPDGGARTAQRLMALADGFSHAACGDNILHEVMP